MAQNGQRAVLQTASVATATLVLVFGLAFMRYRRMARLQHAGAPLSVLLLDVDHFKCVNDHYGYATGDDYLRAIAQVLAENGDPAHRPGGAPWRRGVRPACCPTPPPGTRAAWPSASARQRPGLPCPMP
ncbi:diguanylate cyclase with extracellular sensor [Alicycliphilus sp. B1]|nr:diguanylate cyclase with extracellular sensor [Alicycliphilus sp. B1]